MPFSIGDRLGPYEILARIGAGGMGEVYRARDTKLDRDVAIKVLSAAFAEAPERLARFEREAKVLASLNHPNIAQIYGIEDRALVMELVEGRTLQGPLQIATSLNYAKQIADALEAAHDKGIVHRDLKPTNIVITPQGVAKVLDFGLAAVPQAPPSGAGDPTHSPTLTLAATQAGMIMGTAAYMSPEQAAGKPVDKRADIWSFGVVLWEMVTGQRLFDGETISHTLADVLRAPIDFDKLPKETPPAIRSLLRRCLDRNVKTRLRDIGEARITIEAALSGASRDERLAPRTSLLQPSTLGWKIGAGVLAAAALALSVVAFLHFREKRALVETARFEIGPPHNGQFTCCVSISPDGRKIAFTAQESSDIRPRLWVRSLDTVEAKSVYLNLVGGNIAPHPFWSPDSRFIAFSGGGKLRKVEASGGPAQTICDTPVGYTGGAWSADGVIVVDGAAGLMRVSAEGGDPLPLTRLDPSRQETAHGGPALLPDGRHFLYLRRSNRDQNSGIFVGSLDAKPEEQETRRLLATTFPVVYSPSPEASVGHVLFLRENTLIAQPFDAVKLALAGDAVPVAESVTTSNGRGVFDVSGTGTLIYRTGAAGDQQRRLTWFDRQGKILGQLGDPADYVGGIALSPDAARVATTRGSGEATDIWLLDSRGVSTRLTFDGAANGLPVWSPDGKYIAFRSKRGGKFDLYQKPSNGAGDDVLLVKSDEDKFPTDWSRDGRSLMFTATSAKTNMDLWLLPQGSPKGSQPFPLLRTEFFEGYGSFSPDGRWIAYTSSESGRPELYVRSFAPVSSVASSTQDSPSAGKWQVSKDSAQLQQPRWRSDGKELFFISRQMVMAVDVSLAPVFQSGNPQPLFRLPLTATRWDVTSDGKRFLAAMPVGAAEDFAPISVVLNWTAGLKK
jgi:serine/threonine protein kinase/Tol biopolymer transport system component